MLEFPSERDTMSILCLLGKYDATGGNGGITILFFSILFCIPREHHYDGGSDNEVTIKC